MEDGRWKKGGKRMITGLIIGLFIGGFIGMMIMAILASSKNNKVEEGGRYGNTGRD
jgi:hypothetical protein